MNNVLRFACFGLAFLMVGCGAKQHMIVASSSTVIGLDVSQSPDGKGVQSAFGYKRQELAIVPTDRAENGSPESVDDQQRRGAGNTGNVVMELAYGSQGDTSRPAIHQRLAVGSKAVASLASIAVFFRKPDGNVDVTALDKAASAAKALEAPMP